MSTIKDSSGGGGDFHTIEIDELKSGASVASEPQLTHTPYDPENLSFVSISSPSDSEAVSSTITPAERAPEAGWGSISSSTTRPRGRAAQYLEKKGFGWLLEVEEEGEEEEKPLL